MSPTRPTRPRPGWRREVTAGQIRRAWAARTRRDETQRERDDRARAVQSAREEAEGAGVGRFTAYVTTTVTDPDLLAARGRRPRAARRAGQAAAAPAARIPGRRVRRRPRRRDQPRRPPPATAPAADHSPRPPRPAATEPHRPQAQPVPPDHPTSPPTGNSHGERYHGTAADARCGGRPSRRRIAGRPVPRALGVAGPRRGPRRRTSNPAPPTPAPPASCAGCSRSRCPSGASVVGGADRAAHAHRRTRRARPGAVAAHRAGLQHRGVGAGPARHRQELDHQTAARRAGRVRHDRGHPRRRQGRVHPADRGPRRGGVADRPRPPRPEPARRRPPRRRPAAPRSAPSGERIAETIRARRRPCSKRCCTIVRRGEVTVTERRLLAAALDLAVHRARTDHRPAASRRGRPGSR